MSDQTPPSSGWEHVRAEVIRLVYAPGHQRTLLEAIDAARAADASQIADLQERKGLQLAACDVAALSNTRETYADVAIDNDNPAWSPGRATRALGFRRLITYTLKSETGTSLRASGWRVVGETPAKAKGWNVPSRPRIVKAPTEAKTLWEAV